MNNQFDANGVYIPRALRPERDPRIVYQEMLHEANMYRAAGDDDEADRLENEAERFYRQNIQQRA